MRERRGVNNERAVQRFVSQKLCGSAADPIKRAAEFETAGLCASVRVWKQWKRLGRRVKELPKRGVSRAWAVRTARSGLGPGRLSHGPTLCPALPHVFFDALGLPRVAAGSFEAT